MRNSFALLFISIIGVSFAAQSWWLPAVLKIQRTLSADVNLLLSGGPVANWAFNSYISSEAGYAKNQNLTATQLLDLGIRAFSVEFHKVDSTLYACHVITEVKAWCVDHPTLCTNPLPGCPLDSRRTADSFLSEIYGWLQVHPQDLVFFIVVPSDAADADVALAFANNFPGMLYNPTNQPVVTEFPSANQLQQLTFSVVYFGGGGQTFSFFPGWTANTIEKYQQPCSSSSGDVPSKTPAFFYGEEEIITISGETVYNGYLSTGTMSSAKAGQLATCGFWAGIDGISADSTKAQAMSWTFPVDRPANDTSKNCVQMSYSATQNSWTWLDDNCSSLYYVACQSITNPSAWTVSNRTMSWYEAYDYYKNQTTLICPTDYKFDAPATASQKANLARIRELDPTVVNIWVKLNDIDTEGTFQKGWTGVYPAVDLTIWDYVAQWGGYAAEKWPYILGGFLIFFAICIPVTFLICRKIKKRRLQRGFKEFNDAVSLDDK